MASSAVRLSWGYLTRASKLPSGTLSVSKTRYPVWGREEAPGAVFTARRVMMSALMLFMGDGFFRWDTIHSRMNDSAARVKDISGRIRFAEVASMEGCTGCSGERTLSRSVPMKQSLQRGRPIRGRDVQRAAVRTPARNRRAQLKWDGPAGLAGWTGNVILLKGWR